MNEPTTPIVDVRNALKTFEEGRIPALNGANLTVLPGEFVAIMGPSGCGKSTLLHLIGALDQPDGGEILIGGRNLSEIADLSRYRGREVGFIFQLHNLLPSLTASENVQVPMFEAGRSRRERREHAGRLLALVGLTAKDDQRPAELSGGERQRVAIARALANDPPILLADEPTGSLDSVAGQRILDLLEELRAQRGLTVLLVTHDENVAARADRIVRMLDGRVVDQGIRAHPRTRIASKPVGDPLSV
jgi:putative ABC transport system ATP-binding protein